MSKPARHKVRRIAARPRNAPLTFPDRRFIVSLDELVNELTPRIRQALDNSLDKPDQGGAAEAVRSMVDKLTAPPQAETAIKQPALEQPIEGMVGRTSEFSPRTPPAAPDDPPTIDASTYVPLAERDPELAKTMRAAIERIAGQVPEQSVSAPAAEPRSEPRTRVVQPEEIPLDVQASQAKALAIEFVLWLSRGILLGIGTMGGAALAAWALIQTASYSVKPLY